MSTNEVGFNHYFHVLTFYEEINEAEIQRGDFDIIVKIWNKQQEREQARRKKKNEEATAAESKNKNKQSMFKSHEQMLQSRITRLEKKRNIPEPSVDETKDGQEKTQLQRLKDEKMKNEMQGFT